MKKLTYYPGCSLKTSSGFYEDSIKKVFLYYGIGLKEIEDWSCCGASAAHMVNDSVADLLAARNLSIAEKDSYPFFAPCPACFNRTKIANNKIRNNKTFQDEINGLISPLRCTGTGEVKNIIEVFCEYGGIERISGEAVYDLSSIRAVPYYGCVLTRMMHVKLSDDTENPTGMDDLLWALGANIVSWPYKMECCGAGKTITAKEQMLSLSGKIMDMAFEVGANCIVTPCPLCQLNLDMLPYLGRESKNLPVLFLPELFELALFGKVAGARYHIIPINGLHVSPRQVSSSFRNGDKKESSFEGQLDFIRQYNPEGAERLEGLLKRRDTLKSGNAYGERFTDRQFLLVFEPLLQVAYERARILEILHEKNNTVQFLAGVSGLAPEAVFGYMKELMLRNLVEIAGYEGRNAVFRVLKR